MHAQLHSCIQLFGTPWSVAHLSPSFMGFLSQEYWSGLLFPPPGNLPHPGIKHMSPEAFALADRFFTTEPPGEPCVTN